MSGKIKMAAGISEFKKNLLDNKVSQLLSWIDALEASRSTFMSQLNADRLPHMAQVAQEQWFVDNERTLIRMRIALETIETHIVGKE